MKKLICVWIGLLVLLAGCVAPTATAVPTLAPTATATPVPSLAEPETGERSIVFLDGDQGAAVCILHMENNVLRCGAANNTIPSEFHWSPDVRQIAFSNWNSETKGVSLVVVAVSDLLSWRVLADEKRLGATELLFSWSADSQKIAFGGPDEDQSMADIFIVDVNSGEITNWAGNSARRDENPVYSPDGKKIAFVSDRTEGSNELDKIYVANADGSQVQLVAPEDPGNAFLEHSGPAWSPDGKQIAFYIFNPISEAPDDYKNGIYLMNADGSSLRLLYEIPELWYDPPSPVWSPDGTMLVFEWSKPMEEKTEEVWVVKMSDGQAMHLDVPDAREVIPSWSQNSQYVLFTSISETDGYKIQAAEVATGKIEPVIDGNFRAFAMFSPK